MTSYLFCCCCHHHAESIIVTSLRQPLAVIFIWSDSKKQRFQSGDCTDSRQARLQQLWAHYSVSSPTSTDLSVWARAASRRHLLLLTSQPVRCHKVVLWTYFQRSTIIKISKWRLAAAGFLLHKKYPNKSQQAAVLLHLSLLSQVCLCFLVTNE